MVRVLDYILAGILAGLITFFLVGCSPTNEASEPSLDQKVQAQVETYCELSRPLYDQGFSGYKCDRAGFTALHGVACGYVDLTQFEAEPGKLCRKPGCACFEDGEDRGAKANWSRDMEIMTVVNQAVRPDEDFIARRLAYGRANQWNVCDAIDAVWGIALCQMSPNLAGYWYDLAGEYALDDTYPHKKREQSGVRTGFRAHLDMLNVIAQWRIEGAIDDKNLETVRAQAERQPENGLFLAMASRFLGSPSKEEAARVLLERFPKDRLPTSQDHCEPYLYQRDKDEKDWAPCDKDQTHPGTDFLLAAWVLTVD